MINCDDMNQPNAVTPISAESPARSLVTWSREEESTPTIRARLGAQVVSFRAHFIQLLFYLAALLSALHGCALLRGESLSGRLETREMAAGAPWLLQAALVAVSS